MRRARAITFRTRGVIPLYLEINHALKPFSFIALPFCLFSIFTSRVGRWDCGCSQSRLRLSRTRRTCSRPSRGGACASGNGCSPNRKTTNRTTRSASHRHDARASASDCGRNPIRNSSTRNACISYSSANLPLSFVHHRSSVPLLSSRFLYAFYQKQRCKTILSLLPRGLRV